MTERMIMAGWGGQGLMTLGKLVANIMMDQGKHVTYFPSYGAEVRGGTAHCQVVFSDAPIYSPIVEHAEALLIMNQPSYGRFHGRIVEGGVVVVNSSMVTDEQPHGHTTLVRVPATDLANELGNIRVGNMVMLGAYRAVRDVLPEEPIRAYLASVFTGARAEMVELNIEAIRRGAREARIV